MTDSVPCFPGDLYQDSGVEYSEAENVQRLNEVRVNSAVPLVQRGTVTLAI